MPSRSIVSMDMVCELPYLHESSCTVPDRLLSANQERRWGEALHLGALISEKRCCAGGVPIHSFSSGSVAPGRSTVVPDGMCGWAGAVDVEITGPDGQESYYWRCPRCNLDHQGD